MVISEQSSQGVSQGENQNIVEEEGEEHGQVVK